MDAYLVLTLRMPSVGVAQSAGTFSVTGNMITPRVGHTATLLPNGKVLIAGGFVDAAPNSSDFVTSSAELYDPSTRTFSATGNMNTPRSLHSAALLPSGKVLIVGGNIT
jgi:hypothetical protein